MTHKFLGTLMAVATLVCGSHAAFAQIANGTYKIVARHSAQALDANGSVNASPVMQWPYKATTNEQWVLTSLGGGQYSIKGVQSNRYLHIPGSSTSDNAAAQIYDWQNQTNFKVTLTATDSGYYRINFVHSGKALAVNASKLYFGSSVVQTTYADQQSAQWKFVAPTDVANAGSEFTMILLPDTQEYCSEQQGATKEMFFDQIDWINNQRVSRNIKYVMHVGDIVDHAHWIPQWETAAQALYGLDDTVPYGVAVGNHDFNPDDPEPDPVWGTGNFNQFFGVSHFSNKSYYGGHYGSNNDNHYDLVTANGIDFVVVYLRYFDVSNPLVPMPTNEIDWVNGVLQANPDRRAIVVSHELIDNAGNFKTVGTALYNAIKGNKNLFMMCCGHYSGEGSRIDIYNNSGVVTYLSDYQDDINGGNGKLKVMTFIPAQDHIKVETYSPVTGTWYGNDTARMTVPFPMGPVDGGVYELEPLCAPGKRLEVSSFGTTNGSNVQIWTDANVTSQRWQVQKQSDGSYELVPQHATAMRMEVAGGSTAAGTNVQIYTDNNSAAQRWTLESQSDGNYELIPKHAANLRLDVNNGTNANGTNVKVWTDSNNSAQRWRLIKQ